MSPLLGWRSDLAARYSGASIRLDNFDILPYGPISRRPGLKYIISTKYADKLAILLTFQITTNEHIVLEVGHEYIRFVKNYAQVMVGATAYEIATPYLETEIRQLQLVQLNDVFYITHPNHHPKKLSRLADTNWTFEDIAWTVPPSATSNTSSSETLTLGATTGSTTLTSSVARFSTDSIGDYYIITYEQQAGSVTLPITTNATSTALTMYQGSYNFQTTATWTASIDIEYSLDDGTTYKKLKTIQGASDRNLQIDGEWDATDISKSTSGRIFMRVKVYSYSTSSGSPVVYLYSSASDYQVAARVTAYTSPTQVTASIIYGAAQASVATYRWQPGAFSATLGYPAAISVHEQRLVFGGTLTYPQTFWLSQTDDLENFLQGVADTDAMMYTIYATDRNEIKWLKSGKVLVAGTSNGEYTIASEAGPITPTSIQIKRQSSYGSSYVPAQSVNDVILFTQRGGRKLREMKYEFSSDSYLAPDLTIFSEDITSEGIVQLAYQQQKYSNLWAITDDGKCIYLTYERDQDVKGWGQYVTDGTFDSVCVAQTSSYDNVYFIVERDGAKHIEVLHSRENLSDEVLEDCFYVDSGIQLTGNTDAVLTGLGWLAGKAVSILADGKVLEGYTVSLAGDLTLPEVYSKLSLGLPYTSVCLPVPIDGPVNQDSTRRAKYNAVTQVQVDFINSLGLQIGNTLAKMYPVTFRDPTLPLGTAVPLFTGQKLVPVNYKLQKDVSVYFVASSPTPCNILALTFDFVPQ